MYVTGSCDDERRISDIEKTCFGTMVDIEGLFF